MKHTTTILLTLPALALAGCASTKSQLFFGEAVNFGVTINTGPSADGLDLNLGYKDRSIAIVPASVLSQGNSYTIDAQSQDADGEVKDALSVFGQFKSTGSAPANPADTANTATGTAATAAKPARREVTLGRFFATGIAATNLAEGYKQGWTGEKSKSPDTTSRSMTPVAADLKTTGSSTAPTDASRPPLVFAQTNALGIDIQTAISTEGPQFTIGYAGRNLALIPVTMESSDGMLERMGSKFRDMKSNAPVANDALSVFGQFEANTETAAFNYGLNRFFTTGVAARRLTEGFRARIADDLGNGKATKE